jgi:hypothetical protein
MDIKVDISSTQTIPNAKKAPKIQRLGKGRNPYPVFETQSERRDSNPRPLLPQRHMGVYVLASFVVADFFAHKSAQTLSGPCQPLNEKYFFSRNDYRNWVGWVGKPKSEP